MVTVAAASALVAAVDTAVGVPVDAALVAALLCKVFDESDDGDEVAFAVVAVQAASDMTTTAVTALRIDERAFT